MVDQAKILAAAAALAGASAVASWVYNKSYENMHTSLTTDLEQSITLWGSQNVEVALHKEQPSLQVRCGRCGGWNDYDFATSITKNPRCKFIYSLNGADSITNKPSYGHHLFFAPCRDLEMRHTQEDSALNVGDVQFPEGAKDDYIDVLFWDRRKNTPRAISPITPSEVRKNTVGSRRRGYQRKLQHLSGQCKLQAMQSHKKAHGDCNQRVNMTYAFEQCNEPLPPPDVVATLIHEIVKYRLQERKDSTEDIIKNWLIADSKDNPPASKYAIAGKKVAKFRESNEFTKIAKTAEAEGWDIQTGDGTFSIEQFRSILPRTQEEIAHGYMDYAGLSGYTLTCPGCQDEVYIALKNIHHAMREGIKIFCVNSPDCEVMFDPYWLQDLAMGKKANQRRGVPPQAFVDSQKMIRFYCPYNFKMAESSKPQTPVACDLQLVGYSRPKYDWQRMVDDKSKMVCPVCTNDWLWTDVNRQFGLSKENTHSYVSNLEVRYTLELPRVMEFHVPDSQKPCGIHTTDHCAGIHYGLAEKMSPDGRHIASFFKGINGKDLLFETKAEAEALQKRVSKSHVIEPLDLYPILADVQTQNLCQHNDVPNASYVLVKRRGKTELVSTGQFHAVEEHRGWIIRDLSDREYSQYFDSLSGNLDINVLHQIAGGRLSLEYANMVGENNIKVVQLGAGPKTIVVKCPFCRETNHVTGLGDEGDGFTCKKCSKNIPYDEWLYILSMNNIKDANFGMVEHEEEIISNRYRYHLPKSGKPVEFTRADLARWFAITIGKGADAYIELGSGLGKEQVPLKQIRRDVLGSRDIPLFMYCPEIRSTDYVQKGKNKVPSPHKTGYSYRRLQGFYKKKTGDLVCKECSLTYSNVNHYHQQINQAEKKDHYCDKCRDFFGSSPMVLQHLITEHPEIYEPLLASATPPITAENLFNRENWGSPSNPDYVRHRDMESRVMAELRKHIKKAGGDGQGQQWKCPRCNYTNKKRQKVVNHMKSDGHSGEPQQTGGGGGGKKKKKGGGKHGGRGGGRP